MNDYEVYLFLMSALMHDAGMAHGRSAHGMSCRTVAQKMQNCLPPSEFERIIIFSIAESHHGRTLSGSKDTLSIITKKDSIGSVTFRPALLAAFLRFFDEISEDHERAASYHLEAGVLPVESKIHHLYARMINSVNYSSGIIKILYCANKKDLLEKFEVREAGDVSSTIFLFDWVRKRLQKINKERQYCSRFMWGVLRLEAVHAEFSIVDDRLEVCKTIWLKCGDEVDLEEMGCEKISIDPDYTGDKLCLELNNEKE